MELATLQKDTVTDTEDMKLLQDIGLMSTTTSSTTTTPYTSGGDPLNVQTSTTDTGVLQAIRELDTKMANGFAQIMAKLSNPPVALKGGRRIRKTRRSKPRTVRIKSRQ